MSDEKYAPRELSCLMFENYQGKKANPKAPDLKGEMLINGKAYDAAMWRKEARNGGEYFSLSMKPKGQQSPPAAQSALPRTYPPRAPAVNGPVNEPELPMPEEEDDSIPF